ncbi:BolA family transcriptional regulator [Thalassospira sp. MA62]|nr:BolA family transcriptional regulator [Thalassospira sp. MA62]
MQVADQIRNILTEQFSPAELMIMDDSSKHAGHSGADPRGESHFSVLIVSDRFDGENRVNRQRMVYGALDALLKDRVHALALKTMTPAEYQAARDARNQ